MALKTWIDEIKTAESDPKSEANIEPAGALQSDLLPGEKEADVFLFGARDQIVSAGAFHWTPEIEAAEIEVNKTYKAILSGGRDFTALRVSCAHWIEAVKKATAQPK